MPYSSTKDLPSAVRKLPEAQQKQFLAAFNAAYEKYGEERAFKIAWAAVKGKRTDDANDMCIIETMEFDDKANLHIDSDGYLRGIPRIARTGIQVYKGYEVGDPSMAEVRVYRAEDDVFSRDTLQSFAHKPITLDHPPESVSAKNWRKFAVGQTGGEVIRDGEFIRVPVIVMDGSAIAAVQSGKKQLSAGYGARLVWGAGKTSTGEAYDARQVEIRDNHLAICASARGGPMLCLGDSFDPIIPQRSNRRSSMDKTIIVDAVELEMSDIAASVVQRAMSRFADEVTALKKSLETATTAKTTVDAQVADLTTKLATKDGEVAALNQKLTDAEMTPDKLDTLVNARLDINARARKVLGDSFSPKGKTDIAIQREVCAKSLGDEAVKAMPDAAVLGAFTVITKDDKGDNAARVISDAFGTPSFNMNDAKAAAAKAYNDRNAELENAWKTKGTA